MPNDIFPQPKPTQELPVEQLKDLLQVKIAPSVSLGEFLPYLRAGHWGRFFVDKEFKIFLFTKLHEFAMNDMKVEKTDCILPDGNFFINPITGQSIKFEYSRGSGLRTETLNTREATENKIKSFLKSQGLEIRE